MPTRVIPSTRNEWLAGLALFALVAVSYLPVFHAGFVWDDRQMVIDNPLLRDRQGLYRIWFSSAPADHIPVTLTAFWLQFHFWHLDPFGYHIANLLTHALTAFLLWRVLAYVSVRGAWLAAAVFAVHPVCVASAAWISEQKNTISAVFYLLTILSFLRFYDAPNVRRYLGTLLLFVLALLSKASVVILPAVLLLLIWWRRTGVTRKDLLMLTPLFVLALVESAIAIWFQNHRAAGGETIDNLDRLGQVAAAGRAVWFYLGKSWLPVRLSMIYPQWHIESHSFVSYLPLMAIVAVMAMAWCCRRNWGVHVLFAFGVFMVTLFPVLGFFRMYFLLFSRVSDHWQYLALMASISLLFGAVVCWFRKFGAKLPAFVGPVLACAVLALLVGATFTRAEVFTSEEKLWTDTISKNPNASMPHNNLAFGLLARGDVSGAFSHFNEALKLRPNSAESYFGLANIFAGQGNISEAVRLYSRVIELRSNYPEAHFNLANTLLAAGDPIDAIAHYRAALQFQPENGVIHNNLANVFAQQGNYAEAETHYREAVRLNGGYFEARVNLANILVAQHRLAEAISIYNEALAMQPSNVELNCNLADALAQQGDLAQAVTLTEKALQLAVAQQRTRIVPLVQARLSRYREGSSGVSP